MLLNELFSITKKIFFGIVSTSFTGERNLSSNCKPKQEPKTFTISFWCPLLLVILHICYKECLFWFQPDTTKLKDLLTRRLHTQKLHKYNNIKLFSHDLYFFENINSQHFFIHDTWLLKISNVWTEDFQTEIQEKRRHRFLDSFLAFLLFIHSKFQYHFSNSSRKP